MCILGKKKKKIIKMNIEAAVVFHGSEQSLLAADTEGSDYAGRDGLPRDGCRGSQTPSKSPALSAARAALEELLLTTAGYSPAR